MITFIGLGSNLGDKENNIKEALLRLRASGELKLEKLSSFIISKAMGGPQQPDYVNAVAKFSTTLEPRGLLLLLKSIERQLGRKKTVTNGPRVIDLDILLYEDLNINEIGLIIPHPRMHQRDFVIKPLKEIEPEIKINSPAKNDCS
jgi:2-amino-4-hydroxy-6-hydroxymethyldihydropteridine diphosphokinase